MDYIKAFSLPLKKISEIMKSDENNKEEKLFQLLSRNQIEDETLKSGLILRLKRCIYDGIFDLEKYQLYFDQKDTMVEIMATSTSNVKWLPGDEKITGLYEDKQRPELDKVLKSEKLKYSFLNPWKSNYSDENSAMATVLFVLERYGIEPYHCKAGKDANKKFTEEFKVKFSGSHFIGIDKLSNFQKICNEVINMWREDYLKRYADHLINYEENWETTHKKYILEPLKLLENAMRNKEDTIIEYV